MTPFNSKLSSHKPLSKQLAPFIHLGQDLCTKNMRCADCSTFFQFYNAFILKREKKKTSNLELSDDSFLAVARIEIRGRVGIPSKNKEPLARDGHASSFEGPLPALKCLWFRLAFTTPGGFVAAEGPSWVMGPSSSGSRQEPQDLYFITFARSDPKKKHVETPV